MNEQKVLRKKGRKNKGGRSDADYEGNTIEEATQKGLQALGLTKEDVTIDVLDEGKRILGQEKLAQISMEQRLVSKSQKRSKKQWKILLLPMKQKQWKKQLRN